MRLIAVSIFLLVTTLSSAQRPLIPANVQRQIDSLFVDYNKSGVPGFAVGIFSPSEKLLAKGYGMANLDYSIANTSATVFNVASLSKQFTAACIALLIQKRRLNLNDPVGKYLPELNQYSDTIRLKHLIYMTSGIPEYHRQHRKNGLNWNLYDYFTVDTAVSASLSNRKLDFVPGTQWAYSNVNYMLLTKIVEKLSRQPFSQFAEENLFQPLGMVHTHVNDDVTLIVPNRATGYMPLTSELIQGSAKAGYYLRNRNGYGQMHRNAPHYGGSGVFISVDDWFLWNRNFYTHTVGGQSFYDLMHRQERFEHSKDNDAFGLVFGQFEGQQIIWYAGGDIGFNSYAMRFPKQQLTIVCFSNFDSAGGAEKIAHQIARILIKNNVLITNVSATK